jgi:hypothetical protein
MTMPRLSLYRPDKGNDFKFIDKTAWEMFQVGGTDILVHKYIGPGAAASGNTPSTPEYTGGDNPFNIQDLLFLENRDRKYDPDVYVLRGVYNLSDIDFNLSQFGLFLQNDTIFMTFHITDTVEKLGRKIIAGDVIELPHLKDDYALNDLNYALKRFYVIEEVSRAAEGFSVTWYPHLYRAKCKPLVDSQEYKQILDGIANTDADKGTYNSNITYYPGDIVTGLDGKKYEVTQEVTGIAPSNNTYYQLADSLRDIISTYNREMQITQAVLNQAEADAPKSGYDTSKFYTLQRDSETGRAELVTVDDDTFPTYNQYQDMIPDPITGIIPAQATDENGVPQFDTDGNPIFVGINASSVILPSDGDGYNGYLTEDGIPPNGAPFTAGIAFPINPVEGQFALRKDYLPHRLFRFNGSRWVKFEDNVRMTMNNLGSENVGTGDLFEGKDIRQTQKSTFINNTTTNQIDGHSVKEKQGLSKALRPQADE